MNKRVVALLAFTLLSSSALACSEPHEYVETSRTRMTADIASISALTGHNSHLVNVSARFSSGHMFMLTIPGESVAPSKRLVVEKIVLEDLLKNGDPSVKYHFIGIDSD
jgi:hypothetical protein